MWLWHFCLLLWQIHHLSNMLGDSKAALVWPTSQRAKWLLTASHPRCHRCSSLRLLHDTNQCPGNCRNRKTQGRIHVKSKSNPSSWYLLLFRLTISFIIAAIVASDRSLFGINDENSFFSLSRIGCVVVFAAVSGVCSLDFAGPLAETC